MIERNCADCKCLIVSGRNGQRRRCVECANEREKALQREKYNNDIVYRNKMKSNSREYRNENINKVIEKSKEYYHERKRDSGWVDTERIRKRDFFRNKYRNDKEYAERIKASNRERYRNNTNSFRDKMREYMKRYNSLPYVIENRSINQRRRYAADTEYREKMKSLSRSRSTGTRLYGDWWSIEAAGLNDSMTPCEICGKYKEGEMEVDHRLPLFLGKLGCLGWLQSFLWIPANISILCQSCHRSKSSKELSLRFRIVR